MARQTKKRNRIPYIVVFCEGESEQQYFRYLKDKFHNNAILNIHNKTGLFMTADKVFN